MLREIRKNLFKKSKLELVNIISELHKILEERKKLANEYKKLWLEAIEEK